MSQINEGIGKSIPNAFLLFLFFSCFSEETAQGWGAALCDVTKGSINSQSQLVVNSGLRELHAVALFLSLPARACRKTCSAYSEGFGRALQT